MSVSNSTASARFLRLLPLLLKLLTIFLVVYALHLGIEALLAWADQNAVSVQMRFAFFLALISLYAVVIAIPFVPGVEIALSLLVLRGAEVAPFLYVATIIGLSVAFLVGWFFSDTAIRNFIRSLGLSQAADRIDTLSELNPDRRLVLLRAALPPSIAPYLVNSRYILFGLLLNIPGNIVLGGGGGLALVAGLSRLFRPTPIFITIAIAVLPVPLFIWLMKPEGLGL